jgi:hypothetical protein
MTVRVNQKIGRLGAVPVFVASATCFQSQLSPAQSAQPFLLIEQPPKRFITLYADPHLLCFPFFQIQLPFFIVGIGLIPDCRKPCDFSV